MVILTWHLDGKKHSQVFASPGGAERRARVLKLNGATKIKIREVENGQ